MLKGFSKDLIKYLPSKVLPGIFGILMIPVFTKLFNPSEYGQYILVISTVSVISILASDWIGTSIIRFYPEYQKKSEVRIFNGTILRITIVSLVVISVTSFIILSFTRSFLGKEMHLYLNIGLLILALGIAFNIMMQMLVATRKANMYSFLSVWRQCVCIIMGLLIVVFFNMSVEGMLWGIAIGMMIIIPFFFRITFGNVNNNYYSGVLKSEFMEYGFPLVATNIAAWILSLSDRYIIEYFRGSHEVGLYSISYNLADRSIMLFISLIIIASQPIVMNTWETKGPEATKIFINKLTKLYLVIMLPVAVGLSLLSEQIIKILTSEDFYYGYKVMPMVVASLFLFGLQRNFQLSLLLFKKTNLIMYLVILSSLVNIIANFIFVPEYGFIAAGYTTLVSYMIFAILSIVISRKYLTWKFPFKTLFKVLIATSVMSTVVMYMLKLNEKSLIMSVVFSVLAGSLVYFILLVIMKELDKNTLKDIFS